LCCTPHWCSACNRCHSEVSFDFENTVTRIHEDPRVTKPYSDKQWEDIMQVGNDVEKDLIEDVRLTMGGEPTFVSIDDFEGAEWNTADGPLKRKLAYDTPFKTAICSWRFIHFGQGKWYPGELFPRWQYAYWRKDGLPLWKNDFNSQRRKYKIHFSRC
jgi:uncharacterized protein (DUF2126 family)